MTQHLNDEDFFYEYRKRKVICTDAYDSISNFDDDTRKKFIACQVASLDPNLRTCLSKLEEPLTKPTVTQNDIKSIKNCFEKYALDMNQINRRIQNVPDLSKYIDMASGPTLSGDVSGICAPEKKRLSTCKSTAREKFDCNKESFLERTCVFSATCQDELRQCMFKGRSPNSKVLLRCLERDPNVRACIDEKLS